MTFNIEFNALVPNTCHCVVLCERKLLNLAVYKLGRGIPQRMCLMAHLPSSAHKDLVHMFVSLGRNREAYNVPAIRCLNIEDTHHGDYRQRHAQEEGLAPEGEVRKPDSGHTHPPLEPMTETLLLPSTKIRNTA